MRGAKPSGCCGEGNPSFDGWASAGEHRSQRLAAEDVDVEVRHFLAGALADVGEQPVAPRDQPGVARHLADGADDSGGLMSWKASANWSSWTLLHGSSPRRMRAKMLASS